tara:strand:- start:371 stop:802 length:432 start_codon:yes stop_codon:yes gene_type:complete
MPSPKNSMTFAKVNKQRRRFNEAHDCGVKALAIACNVNYAEAHAALKKVGRRNRWGTSYFELVFAARSLGFALDRVIRPHAAKTTGSLPKAMKQAGLADGRYIVWVSGHILAFVDGRVEDWSHGRRHRVRTIDRVIPFRDLLT